MNHVPRHRRWQIRAQSFTSSQCSARGAFRQLRPGQRGRRGFHRRTLQIDAGPLVGRRIARRIQLRRRNCLRPFECKRSSSCGYCNTLDRPLDLIPDQKCRQQNVQDEHYPEEKPRGERPRPASRSHARTILAGLASTPLGLVKDTQRNAPGSSLQAGEKVAPNLAALNFQQSVTASYSQSPAPRAQEQFR